jgi:hypothetical protein
LSRELPFVASSGLKAFASFLVSAVWLAPLASGLAQNFLKFSATTLASGLGSVTATTLGPDGHLYYAIIDRPPANGSDGKIYRQQIDPVTGLATAARELLFDATSTDENILGLEFAPTSTAENLVLFASFNGGNASLQYRGKISRLDLPTVGSGGTAVRQDYIINLPVQNTGTADHQVNQMDFGPDGRLYFNVGSQSPEGDLQEVPLSAATLVADVSSPGFLVSGQPVDVNTDTGYDPSAHDAKVQLFATGLRNSWDIAWHSNGFAYAPINGNDGAGTLINDPDTLANEGVAAPGANMGEQLALVVEGGYYGHPNPSRGEYITHGGYTCNSLACDSWQHDAYPFPTQPEPGWNADHNYPLLTTITAASLSPNPIIEYTGGGDLDSWLLVGYTTARNNPPKIQAFQVDPATGRFLDTAPLLNESGNTLSAGMPLDLVMGTQGRVYVGSLDGRLIMLTPLFPGGAPVEGDYNGNSVVEQADLDLVLLNWGQATPPVPSTWVNDPPTGFIDQQELDQVLLNWGGTAVGQNNAAVPEPRAVSLSLIALAVLAWLGARRLEDKRDPTCAAKAAIHP